MVTQAGGETRCGIGARLRDGRERKGLTVLQAAERLHVDARILEALESEDFDALGAPVYVRGHLRHYAELVGELPAELQELYSNSRSIAQPDLTRIPKGAPKSDPRRLVIPGAALLTGFALAGAVWWVVSTPKRPAHPAQARSAAAIAEPVSTAPATPDAAAVAPAKSATTTVPTGLAGTNASAAPATDAAARPLRQAQLTLRFTAESWAEVYDSSGARLFYDIGAADSVRVFKGTPPLRIVLGNAPGVAVEVNGHTADLAAVTHADGSAQFVVSRSGRTSQSER